MATPPDARYPSVSSMPFKYDRNLVATNRPDTRPFPDFSAAASAVLGGLHEQLGLDLWKFARADGDELIILQAHDRSFGIQAGQVLRWSDTLCSQMVQGRGPRIAPNIVEVPAYFDAPIRGQFPIGAYIGIPILGADGDLFGTLSAWHPSPMPTEIANYLPMIELSARLLATLLAADMRADEESRRAEWAVQEATTDGLTGLHNRRGWDALLAAEELRCRRYGRNASVVVIDLDGLKLVNDTEGHAAGDVLLRRAARVLKEAARETDVIARVGGDEFALLATETDQDGVESLVHRILTKLDANGVAASAGVASRDPHLSLEDAWQKADNTMYVQKRQRKESGIVSVPATRKPTEAIAS